MGTAKIGAALAGLAVVAVLALVASSARAGVLHRVEVSHKSPMGVIVVEEDSDSSPGTLPPPRDVRATLITTPYRVDAAIGRSGDFGQSGFLMGSLEGGGKTEASNSIGYFNDQSIRNFSSAPQLARAGFLIEGGTAEVGTDSRVEFLLGFQFSIFDATGALAATSVYSEGFVLDRGSTGPATFEPSPGAPDGTLGAMFDGLRRVTIPVAFHTFDIGLVPELGHVTFAFTFRALVEADPTGDAGASWNYADPLSIDDLGGPGPSTTVTFVPEPAALPLLALGALTCLRRTRYRFTHAGWASPTSGPRPTAARSAGC